MEKAILESVKVYSPVLDNEIQKNLNGSPIWTGLRYAASELAEAQKKHAELYEYSFKFEGLHVSQFTGMKKMAK
jgi:hypothetical protein